MGWRVGDGFNNFGGNRLTLVDLQLTIRATESSSFCGMVFCESSVGGVWAAEGVMVGQTRSALGVGSVTLVYRQMTASLVPMHTLPASLTSNLSASAIFPSLSTFIPTPSCTAFKDHSSYSILSINPSPLL